MENKSIYDNNGHLSYLLKQINEKSVIYSLVILLIGAGLLATLPSLSVVGWLLVFIGVFVFLFVAIFTIIAEIYNNTLRNTDEAYKANIYTIQTSTGNIIKGYEDNLKSLQSLITKTHKFYSTTKTQNYSQSNLKKVTNFEETQAE